MEQRYVHPALGAALSASVLLGGCDTAPLGSDGLQTQQQPIRPTEGEGALGNGWGDAPSTFLDSPAGHVRVWYATDGEHEAWPTDNDPADGVPDFVATVAEVGDAVWEHVELAGFALPLPDNVLHDGTDFGGDERFDIYLVNTRGGDGYLVTEACTLETPARCAGYIAIENDFWGYGYPSLEVAITVLVSHEFFHAVQAAYTSETPSWLSEGTATWHEHSFVPGQPDAIRLAQHFFDQPQRGLNSRSRGPADAFSYGAVVFAMYLDERFGPASIVGVFERMGQGSTAEEAVIAEVQSHGGTFADAFAEFTAYTLFTGERAVDGVGLSLAAEFEELPTEDLPVGAAFDFNVELDAWASRTAWLEVAEAIDVTLRALESPDPLIEARLIDPTQWPLTGEWSQLVLDEPVRLQQSAWLVLTNPEPASDAVGRVSVRIASAEGTGEPEDGSAEGSGDPIAVDDSPGSGCAASPARADTARGWLLGLAVLARRRRR